jgi:hypothetical protein
MSSSEPGLDLHEWETEWEALQSDLADAPAEALPELRNLVEQMLNASGFALDDTVASEGDEPEVILAFRAATETTRALERGDEVDPGDIADAVDGLTGIYEYLVSDHPGP